MILYGFNFKPFSISNSELLVIWHSTKLSEQNIYRDSVKQTQLWKTVHLGKNSLM